MRHLPAYQMPTAGHNPSNYDMAYQMPAAGYNLFNYETQLAQYQSNIQQSLHAQNQVIRQYQETMQQSFGSQWPYSGGHSASMYQPAPPVPNLENPPPTHWHRPSTQTDAIVITPSNPTENVCRPPEIASESHRKTSTSTEKHQSEALPNPTTRVDAPTIEEIGQNFQNLLHSKPKCTWNIHDIPVGLSR